MKINSKLCPICEKENFCSADRSCWCMSIKVPEELKELVKDEYRMKSCICKECVEEFIDKKEEFIKKHLKNLKLSNLKSS